MIYETYKQKYLKYKSKYTSLKKKLNSNINSTQKQFGGAFELLEKIFLGNETFEDPKNMILIMPNKIGIRDENYIKIYDFEFNFIKKISKRDYEEYGDIKCICGSLENEQIILLTEKNYLKIKIII
mgnify:FL=1